MLKSIADEIGLDWIYHPLNDPNETLIFETSRGWKETRWIVVSSTFFSIPAIWHLKEVYISSSQCIAEERGKYMSIILLITSLISANYWRKATRGWRRNLDLIFSKFTFLTGCYYTVKYVKYGPYFILESVWFSTVFYVYSQSTKHISENSPNWVKYHFAFHIILTIGIAVLLDSIRLQMNIENKSI